MEMRIQNATDGSVIAILSHEDGRSVAAHFPVNDFPQGSPVSQAIANLAARTVDFAGTVAVTENTFKVDARGTQLTASARNLFHKPFAALVDAARNEKQAVAALDAEILSVAPATASTAIQRNRMIAKWDAANTDGERAALLKTLSFEGAAALIETGAYREVGEDLQKIILNTYRVENHMRRTATQSNFALTPNSQDMLAVGPDVAAATAQSRNWVAGLNARSTAINNVNDMLGHVVDLTTVATGLHRETAWKLLMTGNAA